MTGPPRAARPLQPLSTSRKVELVLEILAAYCRVRWLLWRRNLSACVDCLRRRALARATGPGRDGSDAVREAARLGRAVARTLALLPTDSRCLVRALVLTTLLARRGLQSSLVIGVRSEPDFGAHAWVEHASRPLLPANEIVFERLLEM